MPEPDRLDGSGFVKGRAGVQLLRVSAWPRASQPAGCAAVRRGGAGAVAVPRSLRRSSVTKPAS